MHSSASPEYAVMYSYRCMHCPRRPLRQVPVAGMATATSGCMRPLLSCRPAPSEGGGGWAGHCLFYSLPASNSAMPGRHEKNTTRTHMHSHGNCMACPNECKCHLIQLNTALLGIQGNYCEAFPRVCCCHELQMLDQVFARPCGLQTSKGVSGAYQGQ